MSTTCDICRERPRWALVVEEPEHHQNLIADGIPPDPRVERHACSECASGWPEVYPYGVLTAPGPSMIKKAAAALSGLAIGTLLVGAVGGSTVVDVARGAEAPAPVLIELPAPSEADKLRAVLRDERHRYRGQIAAQRKRINLLQRQLRTERQVRAWAGRDLVAESRLAVTTVAKLTGVPPQVAHRIAHCESRHRPWAQRTGSQYVGLFQLGRNFYPGPFLSGAGDARHPWLNAAAALTVIRTSQGDRQFECSGLTGRAKPGYPANSAGWRP